MAETFGMRPSNKQRSRNKSGNNNNNHNNNQRRNVGNIINRVFESAGPDGKVRGTPQQIIDKYQTLARDAHLSGDRVAAESFLQHSEHYSRMLGEAQRSQAEQRGGQDREDGQRFDAPRQDEGSRFDSPRQDEGSRFDGPRQDEGSRFDGPRRDDGPRFDAPRQESGRSESASPEREQRAPSMDFASSGMATIDAGEQDDGVGGLIETPEGRQAPQAGALAEPVVDPVPGPATEPAPATAGVNGQGTAPEEAAPRPPARRGRPRRTSRDADPAAPAAAAD
jgi:hypothetical protein